MNSGLNVEKIIAHTQEWLEKAVIGLNLCPFAKAVHVQKQIRYVVSDAKTTEALRLNLILELQKLTAADSKIIDTTLLIHPLVLNDFFEYNLFLKVADATLQKTDLLGVIQIASFHPDYQFAETKPDDIENYTNRAPYPMLHLLRESSVERAVKTFPDTDGIVKKNRETLQRLGIDGWNNLKIPTGD